MRATFHAQHAYHGWLGAVCVHRDVVVAAGEGAHLDWMKKLNNKLAPRSRISLISNASLGHGHRR